MGDRISANAVISSAQRGTLAGTQVRLASPEHCLVISALHIVNDLWKRSESLGSWRDVLTCWQFLGTEATLAAFRAAGLSDYGGMLLSILSGCLPEIPCFETPWRLRGTLGARLRALGWSGASRMARFRMQWVARLPVPNAAAFVIGTLVPSAKYIRDRNLTYPHYWLDGIRNAVMCAMGEDFRDLGPEMAQRTCRVPRDGQGSGVSSPGSLPSGGLDVGARDRGLSGPP
jgi:hypothetical protein